MTDIKVHGCGCRYREQQCEHLCDNHRDEFILKLYNEVIRKEIKRKEDIDYYNKYLAPRNNNS